jgi:pilus assembly protein Flp/PilA
MLKKIRALVKDEKGQALAEYGLILALIAVVCIVALRLLGTNLLNILNQIANAV